MIDPNEISVFNKLMYSIMAIGMIVLIFDLYIWRP
jgi:hypothetical protein